MIMINGNDNYERSYTRNVLVKWHRIRCVINYLVNVTSASEEINSI